MRHGAYHAGCNAKTGTAGSQEADAAVPAGQAAETAEQNFPDQKQATGLTIVRDRPARRRVDLCN